MADWRLIADGLAFPEGPAFAPDGSLWCVELKAGTLVQVRDDVERFEVGGAPNGVAIAVDGSIWFCDAEQCSIRRWSNGRAETVCDSIDGEPLYKPNDLCFDGAGNLIFTCPGDSRTEPLGYVCCLRPDGALDRIAAGLYFPNGLALDGDVLYIAETYRHRIWRGEWVGGDWRGAAPWASAGGPVGPDGLAVHSDGSLYAAVYGQQCVMVFNRAGKLLRAIATPGVNPTNVAFGPEGLVLTEAEHGCLWSLAL